MLAFLLAALLPALFWDGGIETAPAVKQAGIMRLAVPAGQEDAWNKDGFTAVPFNPARYTKVPAPGVELRMDVAAATSMPWVDANGWRFQRDGAHLYYYESPAGRAALCAAEAYAYGVDAVIHPAAGDLPLLGRMLAFLRRIDRPRMPALANIGVVDDGSETMGEVLNLLSRRNLLYRVVLSPDPKYSLNVQLGTPEYPAKEAEDPFEFAQKIRQKLGDEKRLVRLFGSDVVLARLTGDGTHERLHLINYSGRNVEGLRVRVLGDWQHTEASAFGIEQLALADVTRADGATEFTIPHLGAYGVVDFSGK